jgi:hypothetical protein
MAWHHQGELAVAAVMVMVVEMHRKRQQTPSADPQWSEVLGAHRKRQQTPSADPQWSEVSDRKRVVEGKSV